MGSALTLVLAAALQAAQAAKPSAEHELLRRQVGTWDAVVEMMPGGAPPSTATGVETSRMVGERWLVTDFESRMMGQPFHGHSITGYDVNKRKYVSAWVDTFDTRLYMGESDYDAATRTLTGMMQGPDAEGRTIAMRMVTEYKDDHTRVVTMYMSGPDGKPVPSMRATYKKRVATAR